MTHNWIVQFYATSHEFPKGTRQVIYVKSSGMQAARKKAERKIADTFGQQFHIEDIAMAKTVPSHVKVY